MAGDARAAMVEQSYVSLLERARSPLMRRMPDTDVLLYLSDLPIPICSGALAPHFAAGQERLRAGEALDVLFGNGQPFQWWSGPLSSSEVAEEVVRERGLVTEGLTPGMHADLALVSLPNPSSTVRVQQCVGPEEWLEANRVFARAFSLPLDFADPFVEILGSVDGVIQLSARLDGEVVGCAAGAMRDGVMGVYNVGTLEPARRRGVGRALTAELMRIGRDRGCHSTILHASEMGYPVYLGLGFEHVTDVSQYVWLPAAGGATGPTAGPDD